MISMKEIQTELIVWLEKSGRLKEELQGRFSSLCEIQEEITTALKAIAEAGDDFFKFTSKCRGNRSKWVLRVLRGEKLF
uniref:NET2A-D/KIP1-like C-terminal domain-containing protein n=1 Tax=Cannabis sativa TaxID=3483 RepID=A0A803PSA7_CANSA